MTNYTTLTISTETLEAFHEAKDEYYDGLGDEVSNERFVEDMLADTTAGE